MTAPNFIHVCFNPQLLMPSLFEILLSEVGTILTIHVNICLV